MGRHLRVSTYNGTVKLTIETEKRKFSIYLTEDQALQVGHRMMAHGSGHHGFETLATEKDFG